VAEDPITPICDIVGLRALSRAVLAASAGLACAVAAPVHANREEANDRIGLDAYARGRLAEDDGALLAAVSAYREAVSLDPGNLEVIRRGYRQAVLAGDKTLALNAAHGLEKAGELPRDGVVLLLIEAVDKGRWADARTMIDRLDAEQNLAFLVPFMRSWVSMRDGPYDPPVVPAAEPYALFAIRYLEEQLLLQRLALGDTKGAAEAYAQAMERKTSLGPQERWIMAARFERLGRHDLALKLVIDEDRKSVV
jgi:tetratricopeptide (TPR) repeat protein